MAAPPFLGGPFWSRNLPKVVEPKPRACAIYSLAMTPGKATSPQDEILSTLQLYVDGVKEGKSALMRPAFHPQASFLGYAGGQLVSGTEFLFGWIDQNGPSPALESRVVSVDVADSIAAVRIEVSNLSGELAGSGVSMSDIFTFLRTPEGWKISQKTFHWHA